MSAGRTGSGNRRERQQAWIDKLRARGECRYCHGPSEVFVACLKCRARIASKRREERNVHTH